MLKRRSDTPPSPPKFLEEVLNASLEWPWKTTRLERDSLHDYLQRSLSANVSVSELYHENSKLYPQVLPQLAVSGVDAAAVRREFLQRRAAAVEAAGTLGLTLELPWRELLTAVARATPPQLFYGVELRVLAGDLLATHEPMLDILQVVKQLRVADSGRLRQALRLLAPLEVPPHHGPLLFVLGCFSRNEVLFGPRGYRRTLLEAGQVSQVVLGAARQRGVAIWPVYEFIDRDVDAVLEADGIEEGTLMGFELMGGGDGR